MMQQQQQQQKTCQGTCREQRVFAINSTAAECTMQQQHDATCTMQRHKALA
jgi:hypothetical protein